MARTKSHPSSMGCPRTTSGAQVFEGVASDLNSGCVCLTKGEKSVRSKDEDGKGSGEASKKCIRKGAAELNRNEVEKEQRNSTEMKIAGKS